MSANPHRGEVPITLDGRDLVLRPSFSAMVEIEQLSGVGILPLARVVLMDLHTVGQMTAVLTAGLNASRDSGAPAWKFEDVGAMLYRTGVEKREITTAIRTFLRNCVEGGTERRPGDDEPGEAKAPGGT